MDGFRCLDSDPGDAGIAHRQCARNANALEDDAGESNFSTDVMKSY